MVGHTIKCNNKRKTCASDTQLWSLKTQNKPNFYTKTTKIRNGDTFSLRYFSQIFAGKKPKTFGKSVNEKFSHFAKRRKKYRLIKELEKKKLIYAKRITYEKLCFSGSFLAVSFVCVST